MMATQAVEDPRKRQAQQMLMQTAQQGSSALSSVPQDIGNLQMQTTLLLGGAPSGVDLEIVGSLDRAAAAVQNALGALQRAASCASAIQTVTYYDENGRQVGGW